MEQQQHKLYHRFRRLKFQDGQREHNIVNMLTELKKHRQQHQPHNYRVEQEITRIT